LAKDTHHEIVPRNQESDLVQGWLIECFKRTHFCEENVFVIQEKKRKKYGDLVMAEKNVV
jgi:hypothetical protein